MIFTDPRHNPDELHGWSLRIQREAFLAQSPERQRETLERVQRLVAERPNSYLARVHTKIYGRLG